MYFSDRLLDVVGAARNKAEKIEEMERDEFLSNTKESKSTLFKMLRREIE